MRIFHQDFILGLIEAARGVSSVCKDLPAVASSTSTSLSTSADTHTYVHSSVSSVAVQAYDDLYATIAISLPDYQEALIKALFMFFHVYEEAVRKGKQQ